MKVLIATKNQGKIEGAKKALEHYFENFDIEGIAVSSDVPDQPVNGQIYEGAKNRVKNLKHYAKENNIDLFIEDSYETCVELSDNGIKSILMTTKMNADIDSGEIMRVFNWNDIYDIIAKNAE